MFRDSARSCLRKIYWSQMFSGEWRCSVGAAPTTSEWSTILLPTKVRLILETWQYMINDMVQNGRGNVICKKQIIYSISHEICTQIWYALLHCCFTINLQWIHARYLPIFFRVVTLASRQSYGCSSVNKMTLKDIGTIASHQMTIRYGKA